MKRATIYLLFVLVADLYTSIYLVSSRLPSWFEPFKLAGLCALVGGIGGVTYCLRGIYLNACVRNSWDPKWLPWYFIRPVVSHICGGVSFAFLRTGLLVLDSSPRPDGYHLGFIVLAFIAGLNVDRFLGKIEDVAQTTWGIEKSRSAQVSSTRSGAASNTASTIDEDQ